MRVLRGCGLGEIVEILDGDDNLPALPEIPDGAIWDIKTRQWLTPEQIAAESKPREWDPNRKLSEREKELVALGRAPQGGNGSWNQLTPETAAEARALQIQRQRAKKFAELEGYLEAHKELAHQVFGAKVAVMYDLIQKQVDGELSDKQRDQLLKMFEQFENRVHGTPKRVTEQTGEVNVVHTMLKLKKELGG